MRHMTLLSLLIAIVARASTGQEPSTAIKYVNDHMWSTSTVSDLATPGGKTVTLSACPPGVRGDEPEFWIYVSGTGTPEAVRVTGGTCHGDGKLGTLQFTTSGSHPAGYRISSASGGLQEALIAGRFTPTDPAGIAQSGKVIVAPGEYKLHATVSVRASNQTIDFTGSIVECYMDDACIYVGDPANSNAVIDVTLVNPRGRPMVPNGTKPFIEVNGQKTRIYNVSTRINKTGTFGAYVQVDDDQAFLLDGLSAGLGYGVRCDATFCGSYVTAPGPFNKWSAVGWLKNLNLSAQCHGNGIDWRSGNTLRISDSVVQGYNQFGVRTGTSRGGYGPTALENVYMEAGNCQNKLGNIGAAGIIAQGQRLSWSGGEGPQGKIPVFGRHVSHLLPVFAFTKYPNTNIIAGAHSEKLANRELGAGAEVHRGEQRLARLWPGERRPRSVAHHERLHILRARRRPGRARTARQLDHLRRSDQKPRGGGKRNRARHPLALLPLRPIGLPEARRRRGDHRHRLPRNGHRLSPRTRAERHLEDGADVGDLRGRGRSPRSSQGVPHGPAIAMATSAGRCATTELQGWMQDFYSEYQGRPRAAEGRLFRPARCRFSIRCQRAL